MNKVTLNFSGLFHSALFREGEKTNDKWQPNLDKNGGVWFSYQTTLDSTGRTQKKHIESSIWRGWGTEGCAVWDRHLFPSLLLIRFINVGNYNFLSDIFFLASLITEKYCYSLILLQIFPYSGREKSLLKPKVSSL